MSSATIDSSGQAMPTPAISAAIIVAPSFDAAIAHFGRLDILVNNAGVYAVGALDAVTPENFDAHYNLNVRGLLLAT